ncbi:MAG: cysteine--tRNA ligase, partial [Candidatus Saccharibacteria bacterium]|nr:cysteine--tRNA ligase [Candidatus Saccharibacteria bacterium]
SKSAHNFYTLPDLYSKGYDALDFRMLTLQSHYRSATNFSWQNLQAARNRLHNWRNIAELRHQVSDNASSEQAEKVYGLIDQAIDALENDLDTPNAIKHFGEAFGEFKSDNVNLEALDSLIDTVDQVLGLGIRTATPDIRPENYQLIDERQQARQNKDWARSDEVRDQLLGQGITIKDGITPIWNRL